MVVFSASYNYLPLLAPRNIRLIKLKASSSASLTCVLHQYPLTAAPHYQAISYCWGSPDDKTEVSIYGDADGKDDDHIVRSLLIPRNLCEALYQLRPETGYCHIWADAICIDQSNLQERSHQVRIMADVYKKAEGVIIWLGQEDGSTRLAMDYIRQVAERFQINSRANLRTMRLLAGSLATRLGTPVPALDATARDAAIQLICDRPWFSRIWVVQEVTFAQVATVSVGGLKVSWDDLGLTAFWLVEHLNALSTDEGYAQLFNATYLWQQRFLSTQADQILDFGQGWRSSDPSDKIYSLLGFQNLHKTVPIVPDYTIDHFQLYTNVVITLIETTGQLTVFKYINHKPEQDVLRMAPSWVPRWDIPGRIAMTNTEFQIKPEVLREWPAITHSIRNTEAVLSLKGWCVDEVVYVSAPVDFRTTTTTPVFADFEVLASLWDAATSIIRQASNPVSLIESLVAAITCNVGVELLPADRDAASLSLQIECFKTALAYSAQTMEDPAQRERMQKHLGDRSLLPLDRDGLQPFVGKFLIITYLALYDRRCFVTKRGSIGLGPFDVQPGDAIALLFGAYQPAILRSVGQSHNVVGLSWIHGLMEENIERLKSNSFQTQEFRVT